MKQNNTPGSGERCARAKPFVKWAGGKSQLLDQYQAYFPERIDWQYIEPFAGGGAVFFWLQGKDCLEKGALLNDLNAELINCYVVIRDVVEALIKALRQHEERKESEHHFYQVRGWDRDPEFLSKYD